MDTKKKQQNIGTGKMFKATRWIVTVVTTIWYTMWGKWVGGMH